MSPLRAELGLLLTTILWGLTFPLLRVCVQTVSPAWVIAIRFTIAFLIFIPFALSHGWGRVKHELGRAWKGAALLGAIAFGSYFTQTTGLQWIGAGRAAFITGTCVVIVPILSPLFGKARPARADWIACAGATLGLFLLTRPDLGGASLRGDLWVGACAVLCAFYIRILPGQALGSSSLHTFNFIQLSAVALLAWSTLPWIGGGPLPALSPELLVMIGVLSVFLTTLTFVLQTACQPYTTPERAAIIFTMEPVWGSLFGYLFLRETFTPSGYAGAGLILASVLLLEVWNFTRS
jgi:drug/metabolite transporter (DMT)-like permease